MSTQRQIEANRANAQRSTGPKTPEGKAAVRFNAMSHRLLARTSFFSTCEGEEYDALNSELREDLMPEGRLELMLVEKISFAYHKLRQAARAEAGLVRRGLMDLEPATHEFAEAEFWKDIRYLHQDLDAPADDGASEGDVPSMSDMQARTNDDIRRRLRKNPMGVQHLLGTVRAGARELQGTNELSARTRRLLQLEFSTGDNSLPVQIEARETRRNGQSTFARPDLVTLLQIFQTEQVALDDLLMNVQSRSEQNVEVARDIASLSDDARIEGIRRCEAAAERQFYRAIGQLERLQRRRTGELSLPPIEVTTAP